MLNTLKKVIRIVIIQLYIALFFLDVFKLTILSGTVPIGILINIFLIYTGMLSFIDRKLKPINYIISGLIIIFYFVLYYSYFFDIIASYIDPLKQWLDKWFIYGFIYTNLILVFGIKLIIKRRHDKYQVIRTIVLIFVQLILAAFLSNFMRLMFKQEYFFSYFWPLKIEYFYPETILKFPYPIILYSFIGSLILLPILALILGKRFYCSWICGCGGLAETFGDKWRHLSNKSTSAWQFEKVSIHFSLAFAIFGTIVILVNYNTGSSNDILNYFAVRFKDFYGFIFSIILSGIIGVGFYPTLGSRIWCRFFCPLAAMLGLIQKLGRFHIRVKKDMCISCGKCSTYCEMGIDVRAYAQDNKSFTRASCVGCGICAHICPRGVLRLENKRTKETII